MKHQNNGTCLRCQEILDAYDGFNEDLREWFEELQAVHPEVHISCAGRGKLQQEELFQRNATRAHYGQSAHNYNCALDLFVQLPGSNTIYPIAWFQNVLALNIPNWIEWYGRQGADFFELPHVELKAWKELVKQGIAKLVE